MRWDDLRSFLAVAREGTLSGAARGLDIDTATVGRQVARLETALGTRLFERTRRGYRLAEAGTQLLVHATTMEREAEELRARVAAPAAALAGPVRIGAPDGISTTLLADVVAEISQSHSALSFQIVTVPQRHDLSMREADILISLTPPESGRLLIRRIAEYDLRLYARRDVAARHGGLTRLSDLREAPIIGYVSDLIQDPALDYLPLINADLKPILCSTSLAVQLAWVREGAGVAVLPDFIAVRWPELIRVLDQEVGFTRSFYLIQHEDNQRVPRLHRTADMIASGLRNRMQSLRRPPELDYPAEVGH